MRQLFKTLDILDGVICQAGYKGYDPYDVLGSPPLLWLAQRQRWLGVAFTQTFRLLPLNVRPILGIAKPLNAKTLGLLARAYIRLDLALSDAGYRERAHFCLDWLDEHRSPGFKNACWGYSFPWCTVRQFLAKDAPSIVCTSFVAHAFLDAYETWRDPSYLAVATSACDFILNDCPRIPGDSTYCFSYTPFGVLPVHNANLLGVSVLGRVYKHTGEAKLLEDALPALQYTLDDQNSDGSWYYHGPYSGRDGTIDNFHTGFVLECLRRFQLDTGHDVSRWIEKGHSFYEQRFFESDGQPRRTTRRAFPVDIRDAAELMVLLGQVGELTRTQSELLGKVMEWTLDKMRDGSGYFYFLRWKHWGYSPLYLRWQAWMLWGMANVLSLPQYHIA